MYYDSTHVLSKELFHPDWKRVNNLKMGEDFRQHAEDMADLAWRNKMSDNSVHIPHMKCMWQLEEVRIWKFHCCSLIHHPHGRWRFKRPNLAVMSGGRKKNFLGDYLLLPLIIHWFTTLCHPKKQLPNITVPTDWLMATHGSSEPHPVNGCLPTKCHSEHPSLEKIPTRGGEVKLQRKL
jgi:hypothetical protein